MWVLTSGFIKKGRYRCSPLAGRFLMTWYLYRSQRMDFIQLPCAPNKLYLSPFHDIFAGLGKYGLSREVFAVVVNDDYSDC